MQINVCGSVDEVNKFTRLIKVLDDKQVISLKSISKTYKEKGIPDHLSLNRLRFEVEV